MDLNISDGCQAILVIIYNKIVPSLASGSLFKLVLEALFCFFFLHFKT